LTVGRGTQDQKQHLGQATNSSSYVRPHSHFGATMSSFCPRPSSRLRLLASVAVTQPWSSTSATRAMPGHHLCRLPYPRLLAVVRQTMEANRSMAAGRQALMLPSVGCSAPGGGASECWRSGQRGGLRSNDDANGSREENRIADRGGGMKGRLMVSWVRLAAGVPMVIINVMLDTFSGCRGWQVAVMVGTRP
jgi:hypothetical protein